MSIQQGQNKYDEFREEFGDYLTYELNREKVLDGFYAAYKKEKPVQQLIVVEDPVEIEDDLYEYFSQEGGWAKSVLEMLSSTFSDSGSGDDYADFMDDFEIEPTKEELLYRCRYDP